MKTFRRLLAAGAAGAGAATVLLVGGPAAAAPLDFAPGAKVAAVCTDNASHLEIKGISDVVPVPGNGAFTPYRVNNGQMLVPISFEVTAGTGLKARHLGAESNKVSKPGKKEDGATTCVLTGMALDQTGQPTSFAATVVGKLTGKAAPTPTG